MEDFIGYFFGISRKKASAVFYDTAKNFIKKRNRSAKKPLLAKAIGMGPFCCPMQPIAFPLSPAAASD